MQSARVTNWIVLGSVAFSVSVCLSLLANRDIKKAVFTGAITIPATYTGAVIIHKRRISQEKRLRNSLRSQIQELEWRKADLNEFLLAALTEEQEVEASINSLESELHYLRSQVSEEYNQKRVMNWELATLQEQKQQQQAELYFLQSQVNTLESQLKELNQSLAPKTLEIKTTETNRTSLELELRELQAQIGEQRNARQTLEQELTRLKQHKSYLIEETKSREDYLNLFKIELLQLQAHVTKQQTEKQVIEQELLSLREEKQQLEEELNTLNVQTNLLPLLTSNTSTELPEEWIEFRRQLSDDEMLVIKAIAEQDNPGAALKKIAQEKLTMPELIIDKINNYALDTLCDRIIEPGSLSIPPSIAEEYLTMVKKIIESSESSTE